MPKQFTTILTALGLPETKVNELTGLTEEQLKDWKPDEIINEIKSSQRSALLEDAEFLNSIPEDKVPEPVRKKIESGQYARFQNELIEVATKHLGLEEKELTAEDRKSIKGLAKKMAEIYLSKKGNVEGLQEMQTKLQEVTSKLEAKDTEWQEKLTAEIEKVNGTNSAKYLKLLTKAELATLEDVKLHVPAAYITEPALAKLNSKYALVLDDNDEIQLMQKGNPKLKALDSKNQPLNFRNELRAVVLQEKLGSEAKKELEDLKKKRVVVGGNPEDGDGGGTVELPSYIADKIKEVQQFEK